MAAMSDYLQDALIKAVLCNTSYTSPATVYLAAFTDATTEVTGGSYARQSCAFTFGSTGSGSASNTASETFTGMPACTVTHLAVYDASSGGNLLVSGAMSASKTLTAGQSLVVAAGAFVCTFL